MPHLGVPELLVILALVVIIFGASKLPQLGRGLGEGIKNFRHSMREGEKGPANDDEKPGEPK